MTYSDKNSAKKSIPYHVIHAGSEEGNWEHIPLQQL